jgi:hypothetical protein
VSGEDSGDAAAAPQGYITAVNAAGRIPLSPEGELAERLTAAGEEARV